MFQDTAGFFPKRGIVPIIISALALFFAPRPAAGADARARHFDIPAGDAAETLKLFAVQASREIMFPAEPVAGVRTHAVSGSLTPREALDRMIAGTELMAVEDSQTGALMIERVPPRRPGAAPPPNSGSTGATEKPSQTMDKLKNLRTAGLLMIFLGNRLAAQTATAEPPPPSPEAVVLPSFEVNETADKGYLAGNSVSATRVNTPIADLPFSISAFTGQFMADINARDLYDVVRYSSGVVSGSSGFLGGDTSFLIRGFKQSPEHDGFYESSNGNVYVDTVAVERVEVVKGPASLLYGAVSPGGTVNYITKKAEPTPFINVNGQFGSWDFGRVTLDINQPILGNILLFRINVAMENGYEFVQTVDGVKNTSKTAVIVPTLTWNITPKVSLRVNYQGFFRNENAQDYADIHDQVATPTSVVAALYNAGYPGPSAALTSKTGVDAAAGYSDSSNPGSLPFYNRFPENGNYVSDHDFRNTNLQSLDAELDVTLGEHWKSRINFDLNRGYSGNDITGQNQTYLAPPNSLVFTNGKWSVAPAFAALSATQQLAQELAFANGIAYQNSFRPNLTDALQNGVQAPAVSPRIPDWTYTLDNNHSAQWETVGDYAFSWGKLKPMAGLFFDANNAYSFAHTNTGSATSPYFRTWDIDPYSPTFYENSNTSFDSNTLTTINTSTLAYSSDQAVYGILNASFLNDTLYFVGGVRYNASESQTTNYLAASPVGEGYRTHYTTPQVGMGYKILPDLLFYASYSESYTLPSTTFLSTIETVNGLPQSVPTSQAVPTTGQGYEAGLKTNFLNGRIASTLSVYDITQNNVTQTFNQNIGGLSYAQTVQQTQITSKGVEFETTLSPVDNWQIFVSASEDDARNTKEPVGYAFYLGEPPALSAKTLINLWTRYTFKLAPIQGIWVGAGLNFTSKMLNIATDNVGYFPPVTIYSAAIGYDWAWRHVKLNAKLHVENLGDTFYVPATQLRALPRTFVASVGVSF